MSITFAISDYKQEDARRVTVNEDLIAYFDNIYDQTGIDTGFFLGLDPYEMRTFTGVELEDLESYLADLESQLADFFIRGIPTDLEPPVEFGAGQEGEGTEPQEEGVLKIIGDLLELCREALEQQRPLLAIGEQAG